MTSGHDIKQNEAGLTQIAVSVALVLDDLILYSVRFTCKPKKSP